MNTEISIQINAKLVDVHRTLINYIPLNSANSHFFGQKIIFIQFSITFLSIKIICIIVSFLLLSMDKNELYYCKCYATYGIIK